MVKTWPREGGAGGGDGGGESGAVYVSEACLSWGGVSDTLNWNRVRYSPSVRDPSCGGYRGQGPAHGARDSEDPPKINVTGLIVSRAQNTGKDTAIHFEPCRFASVVSKQDIYDFGATHHRRPIVDHDLRPLGIGTNHLAHIQVENHTTSDRSTQDTVHLIATRLE